ncbi:MAG: sigma-54 dependent transcriptional regulator [Acidobacteriota bacterium]
MTDPKPATGGPKARILVVDDEPRMAESVAVALRRSGYRCHTCVGGAEALAAFDAHGADVVVTDRRMPGMDGVELMGRLLERSPELPVILVTAFGDVRSAVAAMGQGAFHYLTKPFDHDELRGLVARALELGQLQRENRLLRTELGAAVAGDLIAEDDAMTDVLDRVDRAAPSDATVLIQGESGTGKEGVARRLHARSPRLGRPFVAVNCKAFAPGVLESELFGHEKGAFTGATAPRPGCFERADGGTLFLDEIGETEPDFQAKLLRALQEGEVQRVGGGEPRRVDVRIVAATNRDLRREIAEGRFREDLFYRLAVIPVTLPPLRRRPGDVLPLARHFLGRCAERSGRPLELTDAAEAALLEHPWPGNVRELENAIERASVLARTGPINAEDLLLQEASPDSWTPPGEDSGTLQESLDLAAARRIRRALERHGGRRAEAAAALGVDRTTLFRWMKRLGI